MPMEKVEELNADIRETITVLDQVLIHCQQRSGMEKHVKTLMRVQDYLRTINKDSRKGYGEEYEREYS